MIFQKPVFGLDISDRSIEMVEVRLARAKWRVKHADRLELAPGIIEDGEILQPDALVNAMESVKERGKFPKDGRVILSFPDNNVYTTTVSLPTDLDKKELSNTIEVQGNAAKELVKEIDIRHNHALLVQKIGQITSTIMDIDQLTTNVMDIIKDHLVFDRGLILLTDKESSRLYYQCSYR